MSAAVETTMVPIERQDGGSLGTLFRPPLLVTELLLEGAFLPRSDLMFMAQLIFKAAQAVCEIQRSLSHVLGAVEELVKRMSQAGL